MTTNPKMMPRQHIGYPVAHGDTSAKGSDGSVSCKDGGVLPITGFPHVGGKVKEEHVRNNSDMVQTRASHTTHIRSRKVVSGLYLRSVHF